MNLGLKDKVVIVTWDSKGMIGEISNLLAAEGAIPVLVSSEQQNMLNSIKTIHDKNQNASYAFPGVISPENCKDVVASVKMEFGRIDGLVNISCVNDGVGLESGNYEDLKESISKYSVHCNPMAHYVLPELKKSKGAIVNIDLKTSGYAATNEVRNTFMREWAAELLPYNIRVNAVIVSESCTPIKGRSINTFVNTENEIKEIIEELPFKNLVPTCKQIANTVVFLLSDKSGQTTGQLIVMNVGHTTLDKAF